MTKESPCHVNLSMQNGMCISVTQYLRLNFLLLNQSSDQKQKSDLSDKEGTMAEGHRKRKKKQTAGPRVSNLQQIRKKWGGEAREMGTYTRGAGSSCFSEQSQPTSSNIENCQKTVLNSPLLLLIHQVVYDSVTPWTAAQQASPSFIISQSLLKLMPLSQWCHPTISSSVTPFSSCLQSFPASGSFPMSWLFASSGQSTGVSASVLPINIQDWSPLGQTGLIPLLSKGLSRVFFNTTIWKHEFFGTQPSLWSNSHICTWLLEKL